MMDNYKIEVEETYQRQLNVEANSLDDAVEKVHNLYKLKKINAQLTSLVSYKIKDEISNKSLESLAREVVYYLYKDEKRHYEETEEGEKKNHIYLTLKNILNIID